LAEGLGDRDIAAALTISRRTVETHVSSILHKLGAQNRTEVAARYHDES
jgi:DNA-binding NarL/FixJ family response regulator